MEIGKNFGLILLDLQKIALGRMLQEKPAA